jgi:hypothetical protein
VRRALAVLALLAACRSKEPPAASPPPAAPTDAAAMAPPAAAVPARPGLARLTLRGAVTRELPAASIECSAGAFQASVAEARLVVTPTSAGQWMATLALGPDGARPTFYRWFGAPPPGLVATPGAATIALTLTGEDGARVDVAGELRCPVPAHTPVPPDVTAILARHAGTVRAHATHDFGRERDLGAASAILSGDPDAAEAVLRRVRADLPAGWVAYLGTARFLGAEQHPEGSMELVVARGTGPLDIVRAARTDAANYDLDTEQLVHRLAAWDRAWGIDVIQAQTDTLELALRRLPDDMAAFTRDVYALCPDAVEQGAGSLAALQQEITARRRVDLWWD